MPVSFNGCIRINRDRTGFNVSVRDPELDKANQSSKGSWQDPDVEYNFKDKAAVIAFLTSAIDIALPEDTYSSAFDKLAEEAGGKADE